MNPIDRSEVLPIGEYETIRDRFRARVIAEKRLRRVQLGEHISAVFENRDSVLLQIQEMLRTERITAEHGILHEIATYNELIPGEDELSMTLFVEILDKEVRERTLVDLAGLERHVALFVDGEAWPASGERQGAQEGRTTAVHYLKVKLPKEVAARARARAAKVAVVVSHPRYQARVDLEATTLERLAEDLS